MTYVKQQNVALPLGKSKYALFGLSTSFGPKLILKADLFWKLPINTSRQTNLWFALEKSLQSLHTVPRAREQCEHLLWDTFPQHAPQIFLNHSQTLSTLISLCSGLTSFPLVSAVLTHLFIEAVAEGHGEDGLGVQLRHGDADGHPCPETAGQGQSGRLRPQDRPSPACLLFGGDSRPVYQFRIM